MPSLFLPVSLYLAVLGTCGSGRVQRDAHLRGCSEAAEDGRFLLAKPLLLPGMRLLNTRHPTSIFSVLFLIFSSNNFLLYDTNILLTFSDIYFVAALPLFQSVCIFVLLHHCLFLLSFLYTSTAECCRLLLFVSEGLHPAWPSDNLKGCQGLFWTSVPFPVHCLSWSR